MYFDIFKLTCDSEKGARITEPGLKAFIRRVVTNIHSFEHLKFSQLKVRLCP